MTRTELHDHLIGLVDTLDENVDTEAAIHTLLTLIVDINAEGLEDE